MWKSKPKSGRHKLDPKHWLYPYIQAFYIMNEKGNSQHMWDSSPHQHHLVWDPGTSVVLDSDNWFHDRATPLSDATTSSRIEGGWSDTGDIANDRAFVPIQGLGPQIDSTVAHAILFAGGNQFANASLDVVMTIPRSNNTEAIQILMDDGGRGSIGYSSGNTTDGVDAVDDSDRFSLDLDVWRDYAITFNGEDPTVTGNYTFIAEGTAGTTGTGAAYAGADSSTGFRLANSPSNFNFNGDLGYVLIIEGIALSLSQVVNIQQNPWQLLKPRPHFALADVPSDAVFSRANKPKATRPY
jgi:hypothetical protein